MSRRKRKQPQPPAPDIDAAEIPLPETLPQSPLDRKVKIAEVVIRNMIGVIGVLFLGWPAQTLIVLYFFDTIAAMMSIFAALMFSWLDKPEHPRFSIDCTTSQAHWRWPLSWPSLLPSLLECPSSSWR